MFRTFAATSLLTLACVMPVQQAAAQDAIGGAIFGGAAGALLGGAIGGRGGAIAGGIIGGTTGAAIAAEGQRRREGYYWYRNGCYMQRPARARSVPTRLPPARASIAPTIRAAARSCRSTACASPVRRA